MTLMKYLVKFSSLSSVRLLIYSHQMNWEERFQLPNFFPPPFFSLRTTMHHPGDRLPILSFLLVITSFTLIHIPNISGQDQQFDACKEQLQCGNFAFTYPFWGRNRPESCGYPGFNLSCDGNIPRFTVGPVIYRIVSPVDTSAHTLTVARDDLWADNCPRYLHNTTLNFDIFSYPNNNINNITLSYNCNVPANLSQQLLNQFPCTINTTTPTASFFGASASANNNIGQLPISVTCTDSISDPINQAAVQSLITNGTAGLRAALAAGFPLQYEANNTACTNCTNRGGQCGYNTRSNSFACYNQSSNGGTGRKRGLNLVTGLLIAVAGSMLLGGIFYCLRKGCSSWEAVIYRKSDEGDNQQVEAFMRNYGSVAPKLYKYSEIRKMTNSFAKKLGHGGFGSVYRGKLSDGRLVAVKVLNDNKGNGEEFINEVASISRTSHVNVVNLLGFCYDRTKRALIYEFMPNGSLDRFIYQKRSPRDTIIDCQLEWKTLYEIAVGTARGLEYLHRGCNTRIVHFDIKPQNILLDKDFCPKISDFGLARLCKQKQSILSTIGARGTAGYIAPEVFCRNFGGISHKSDVYSYGMMLLEIVGLRRKIGPDSEQTSERCFPDWIYEQLELGKDLEIQGVMNEEEGETSRKMNLVGLWCIQTNPADRPSMSKVVEMLEGSLEHLKIPPKPFLDSPPMAKESTQESSASSISIS